MKSKETQSLDKLSARQEKMIALLLTERTAEAASAKANVAPSTLWRWMKTEGFRKEYRKIRMNVLENSIAKLQGLAFLAIETLERNLNCENPPSEIRAAQIILEQAIRGAETLDVEQRLEYMELLIKREGEGVMSRLGARIRRIEGATHTLVTPGDWKLIAGKWKAMLEAENAKVEDFEAHDAEFRAKLDLLDPDSNDGLFGETLRNLAANNRLGYYAHLYFSAIQLATRSLYGNWVENSREGFLEELRRLRQQARKSRSL